MRNRLAANDFSSRSRLPIRPGDGVAHLAVQLFEQAGLQQELLQLLRLAGQHFFGEGIA